MSNTEATLAKFEDIDFVLADRPDQKLDVSVFPLDRAAVLSQVVLFGGSLVTAGPNTGKTRLLEEVRQIAENAASLPTLYIDANKESGPSGLSSAPDLLEGFNQKAGSNGLILIDHADNLMTSGLNVELNAQRRRVRTMAFGRDFGPAIVAASLGSSNELKSEFKPEQQYEFTGAIDILVAQSMLKRRAPDEDAESLINRLINSSSLTYANIQRIIEGGKSSVFKDEVEPDPPTQETFGSDGSEAKLDLQAMRTAVKLSTLIAKRHSPEVAEQFIYRG